MFSASSHGLSAQSSFEISGGNRTRQLTILLSNIDTATGAGARFVPSQVMTELFFNLGTSTFTPVPATPVSGGSESSYGQGGVNWLSGTNYDNPNALDGINLGIVPDGWTSDGGNGGLDTVALIEATVKFVLKIPGSLSETDIKNHYFNYGTRPN